MTDFKTLEDRYNDRVNPSSDSPNQRPLYADAKTKFAGGKPSIGKSDDPIIVRAPGESQKGIKSEDRGKPFVSAPVDTERLKRYLVGPKGVQFLLKQQLLQTGNTFAATRIINPLFVLGNTTPFVHTRRSLRPISVDQVTQSLGGLIGGRVGSAISFAGGLASSLGLGKQSNDITSLRKIAQLQQETFDKLKSKGYGSDASSGLSIGGLIKKIVTESPLGKTITGIVAKRSMGEVGDGWKTSRPELKTYIPDINYWYFKENQKKLLGIKYTNRASDPSENASLPGVTGAGVDALEGRPAVTLGTVSVTATSNEIRFLKYFDTVRGIKSATRNSVENGNDPVSIRVADKDGVPFTPFGDQRTIRYIFDPSNDAVKTLARNKAREIDGKVKKPYQDLPINTNPNEASYEDPINVSFAIGKDNHIQFRAFFKDFTLATSPEYKTYQYVGRIEKFVNYVGVQREASFKLSVIAFSKSELDTVWTRINYLTGMVFPYGFTRGILQPNIIRLSIGDVFHDQPGYITSLNTSFNDVSESWEIDENKQVPISATMDIRFVIIEKKTKISISPFFAITENMKNKFTETVGDVIADASAPGGPQIVAIEDRLVGTSTNV